MDETKSPGEVASIGMFTALGIYTIFSVILVICYRLAVGPSQISLTALAVYYLASGIILNIVVLKRLIEWHQMYNTIDNVAGAKIRMILFWPFAYPILFIKILIVKYL